MTFVGIFFINASSNLSIHNANIIIIDSFTFILSTRTCIIRIMCIVIQHFLFPNYCNSTAHYFRLFSHHGLSNVHFFAAHYFLILLVDIFNVTKKRERTSPTTASSFSHTQVLQAVPKQDRVLNNTAICLQAVTYINYDKKKLTIYQAF